MTLWDLKINQKAFIKEVSIENQGYEKLLSYGFKPNQPVKYLYKMSFGGPRVYQVGDIVYSLSSSMAKSVCIALDNERDSFDSYLSTKIPFNISNLDQTQPLHKN